MSLLEQLVAKVQNNHAPRALVSREDWLRHISGNYLEYLYNKHWKFAASSTRIRMLVATSLALVSVYIVSPTISYYLQSEEQRKKMFSSKRQDKHTTGLINTRNDCFANSSIQAFAALPGLNDYLNELCKQHKLLESLPLPKDDPPPEIPLHIALATIVQQLQEPVLHSKQISVWTFLHVIEKIFNSRISTNQNDAHELVQLILETLDNETTKLKKYTKKHKLNLVIPELPFNGLLADQLTCYSCLNSSKPSFHPFSVLSLAVPQEKFTTLNDMLKNNEMETINGYHCLRCKIKAILKVENERTDSISEEESQLISRLKVLEPNLTINDDLPKDLDDFVKNYNANGFKTDDLLSMIVKKTLVIKPPKVLTVHLSRSMYTANHLTRNGCRVEFEEVLNIDVDENLAKEYEVRQKAARKEKKVKVSTTVTPHGEVIEEAQEDEASIEDDIDGIEGYDDDRHEPEQLKRIHSKVLTEHDEDASVAEVEHSENPDDSDHLASSTDATSIGSKDRLADDEDDEDPDDVAEDDSEDTASEELNITKDKAKYRLRAMIRHQGTHQMGHYECYRHKPLFVKDTITDTVVCLSPKINFGEEEPQPEPETQSSISSSPPSNSAFLQPGSPVNSPLESISRNSRSSVDDTDDTQFSKFRSRLGSIVGRRSSVGSSPTPGRRQSVAHMVSTPAPEIVATDFEQLNLNSSKKKRYKKVPTVSKYPYWRISDTNVSEVKKDQLLCEKTAVYMLYYEKVE